MEGSFRDTKGVGTGYGTILQSNDRLYDQLLADAKEKAAAKKADAEAYNRALKDAIPEFSFIWNGELTKRKDELITRGGELMEKGISNPWISSDPESRKWVQDFTTFTANAKQSMQLQQEYEKGMGIIQERGDDYTEESKAGFVGTFYNNPLPKFLDGQIKMPKLILKAPLTSLIATEATLLEGYKKMNPGRILNEDDYLQLAKDVSIDPKLTGYTEALSQEWERMSEEQRNEFKVAGINKGDKTGMITFIAKRLEDRSGFKVGDIGTLVSDIAKEIGKIGYGTVTEDPDTGKTVSSTGVTFDSKALKAKIKNILLVNQSAIDKDVEAGLYGSKNMTPEQRFAEAENYWYKIAKAQIDTDDKSSTTFQGSNAGGAAKEAKKQAANLWLNNIKGLNGAIAQKEATGYLVTAKQEGGFVTDAMVNNNILTLTISKSYLATLGEDIDMNDKEALAERLKKTTIYEVKPDQIKDLNTDNFQISVDVNNVPEEQLLRYFENVKADIPYGSVRTNKYETPPPKSKNDPNSLYE